MEIKSDQTETLNPLILIVCRGHGTISETKVHARGHIDTEAPPCPFSRQQSAQGQLSD